MVNNTICEFGNVLINGAKVVTINSESTEIEDIKKTIADCQPNTRNEALQSPASPVNKDKDSKNTMIIGRFHPPFLGVSRTQSRRAPFRA